MSICKFKKLFMAMLVLMLSTSLLCTFFACNPSQPDPEDDEPSLIRLVVPKDWELEIGDSRTVDCVFDESIVNQTLAWSVSNDNAVVDKWGRVTALKAGTVKVTAVTPDGHKDSAVLNVVGTSTSGQISTLKHNYGGNAVVLGDNWQKIVTRYTRDLALASDSVPTALKEAMTSGVYADMDVVTYGDVVWEITSYGVLRTDPGATYNRDKEQRFMGDRYFYSADTTDGKILAIYPDGKGGIWAVMAGGVTRIELVKMTGTEKATEMVETTQQYVMRHGFVAEAFLNGSTGEWKPAETDNDGLWTAMYAAGELMRYASLKNDPNATPQEIAEARESAYVSTEAVLLLSNISMRTGTVEAYVRYQPNGYTDPYFYGSGPANGRFHSAHALEKGGDYSMYDTDLSPAEAFERAYEAYQSEDENGDPILLYCMTEDYLNPRVPEDWSDPRENADGSVTYETRTRNLEGYIARTISFDDEGNDLGGYIYWHFERDEEGNLVARGVSTKTEDEAGYYLNGENLRDVIVDASGQFPTRLWNDLVEAGEIKSTAQITDVVYKGDTSSDEVIGHLFLYKLAYDILGAEDAELKEIIASTVDRFAQHVTDNGYMMVDGSGQPGTWSKYNREFFTNSSQLGGAPLTALVCLSTFKLAHYVTGDVKWHNEYMMCALDPAYEYARITTQYKEQCHLYMLNLLNNELGNFTYGLITADILIESYNLDMSLDSDLTEMLMRLFLNYSDEEMAMLAFYILFQMETDETLLAYYRDAIDDWWMSIKYSENPLWYYIYQLAYPNKTITDAYGNNILETAAWSLSRHPVDTRRYLASNTNRDDMYEFDLNDAGLNLGEVLSYTIAGDAEVFEMNGILSIIDALRYAPSQIEWAVASPDERSFHKYNGSTYGLDNDYNPWQMEGSTTYTLPYWMGIYHNMLVDIAD